MTPPPAEELVPRLFIGPALRAQSDRRLVRLVREGYEAAFEEIVRRYGAPLRRYAAAIVGGRAEDVTQDAFSKALLALRGDGNEVELRPWLYRIVRNTALNDLRDRPPTAQELNEAVGAGGGVGEEVERRAEVNELIGRLRALPEAQRAAIVMRELEGLSHEEIAAALGITGGAARQAIHRARTALRNAVGVAIPLPILRVLIDQGAEATVAVGAAGAGMAAAGASVGAAGTGGALKVGLATALIAGSVGTGVALEQDRGRDERMASTPAASASEGAAGRNGDAVASTAGTAERGNDGSSGRGGASGSSSGPGPGHGDRRSEAGSSGPSSRSGPGSGEEDRSGSNSGPGGGSDDNAVDVEDSSGPGGGGTSGSGSSGSGSGAGSGGGSGSNSGPGSGEASLSTESGSGEEDAPDSSGSGSSGTSGSGSSGSGSGEDDLDDD